MAVTKSQLLSILALVISLAVLVGALTSAISGIVIYVLLAFAVMLIALSLF